MPNSIPLLTLVSLCIFLLARQSSLAQEGSAKASAEPNPTRVRFDPVLRDIEGWKVYVEPALLDGAHCDEGAQAIKMLANHLQRIKIVVLPEPLAKLQTIEI